MNRQTPDIFTRATHIAETRIRQSRRAQAFVARDLIVAAFRNLFGSAKSDLGRILPTGPVEK